jgi:hypothetical protein
MTQPQCEREAFGADRAPRADSFCLGDLLDGQPGGRRGKEKIRIRGSAGRDEPPVTLLCQHCHTFLAC